MGARNPSRNRVVVPARQCCSFRTIFGSLQPSRNRVVVPARQATSAGGINSWSPQKLKIPLLVYTVKKFRFCIPRKGIARPQSQYPYPCVCERFIYSHVRSTYCPAAEQADRSGKFIDRSQKHEYRNWDCSCAVPFLGIFVSIFGVVSLQCSCLE